MVPNPIVDEYFTDGCGRCPLAATPECKVHRWKDELKLMRELLLESGLQEERKWGVPCYTYKGKNVILLGAFKENCVISFLKGVLLKDPKNVLELPGENSQSTRFIRITSLKQLSKLVPTIKAYLQEAILVEKSGQKVELKKTEDYEVPSELSAVLKKNASLRKAWEKLTPGRKRSYLLHVGSAKQEATRVSRVEKIIPGIMAGKGFGER